MKEAFEACDLAFSWRWKEWVGAKGQAVLARLMRASRQGQLCIELTEEESLPSELVEFNPKISLPPKPLCQEGSLLYLQRSWVYETYFLEHLHRLSAGTCKLCPSSEEIERILSGLPLNAEQLAAVRAAIESPLSLLCGGPGTGKTYTAGMLIRSLIQLFGNDLRIALAAPTGKAAIALQRSLERALGESACTLHAQTLHRMLGQSRRKVLPGVEDRLPFDVILVDEASMIDVELMARLMAGVKDGARLVLLGDSAQLPPVECGAVFYDLVQLKLLGLRIAELVQCKRVESQELLGLAAAIRDGNTVRVLQLLHNSGTSSALRETWKSPEALVAALGKRWALPYTEAAEDLMEVFSPYRILSPLRKGAYGSENLNMLFYRQAVERQKACDFAVFPIMVTRNDYEKELFNGEVGVLVSKKGAPEEDYALFEGAFKPRRFPALLLPCFEYAYCLSIHKSQGSEFKEVSVLLPEGAEHLSRALLYTALTRARARVELVGTVEDLVASLGKTGERRSGIKERCAFASSSD